MISTTVLVKFGILLASFIVGILFYYFLPIETTKKKKDHVEDVISLVINFILFIWLGKIILNIDTFIRDPLAVLAFPSNAKAFYVATVFIIINLLYRYFKHKQPLKDIFVTFLPIFLASGFMHEFLKMVVEGNSPNIYYLIVLVVLLIVYVGVLGKTNVYTQSLFIGAGLLVSQVIISFLYTLNVFGFILSYLYFLVLLLISLATYIYRTLRKV